MFYLKKRIKNTTRCIKLSQCAIIMSHCLDIFVYCYIINLFQENVYAIRRDIATKQFIKALCEKSFSCLRHTFSTLRLLKIGGLTMVEKRIFFWGKR